MRRLFVIVALFGCTREADTSKTKSTNDKTVESGESGASKLAGVWPDKFDCKSITTAEIISATVGGTARQIENPGSVPRGVAHPCVYEVATGQTNDAGVALAVVWTYDFDCRDNYKKTADTLFEEYKKLNADRIEEFDRQSDAGLMKPNDAGIEYRRPGEYTPVEVGQKAVDHHGQGLLFIDDDAPCYVRVVGPDQAGRLALAQLIAKSLTYQNAPMTPRPLK
jgi:hypothetical protein